MNHELVEMFKDKLDNITISDYHGLKSPGLTCYLNSVLQVLFMTEDFREAVKRCCSKDSAATDPHLDPHLGKLFNDLQKSMATTHNITKKLGIMNVYEQRDAAEYFQKILGLTSPEAAKIFKGELNHRTTCLKCKETNDSRSFFWILPLALEESSCQSYSVEKGLKAFFKGEKVSGDNRMYCNRCNKKRDAALGCEMTQSPEILTLLLKRFHFDYKRRCFVKLHGKVDVPQTLHLENCTYDLYALVHHFGNLTGGHYTAQIKSFETLVWYHFNDDIVEGVKQPRFGTGDNSLRSCTAYLLMYRKVSRNPENTDEGDQEALCAHLDVEAEGRHDEEKREEAPVPHHQLKDESCNGRENKHLNGDILKMIHDDPVSKKLPNFSGELVEQLYQRADTGADGDSYKPSLQRQKLHFAKLQKDGRQKGHEPNGQQLDTNSKEDVWHLNTRGSNTAHLRTQHVEQSQTSQKKKRQMNETDWETQDNIIAESGTTTTTSVIDSGLTRNRVKPAEINVLKIKKEAEIAEGRTEGKRKQGRKADVCGNICHSDVSFSVSQHGYSSSSVPYQTENLQSQFNMNEPIRCNYSPSLYRKSNSPKRDKEKKQHVVTEDSSCQLDTTRTVTKGGKSTSPREKRNAAKSRNEVNREPWR